MLAPGTLQGRTAVVTGGGTGMGLAIAKEYARLGANVVIASRKIEVLEAAEKEIRESAMKGAEVAHFVLDVRQPEGVEEVAAKVTERFGPATILVNNAAGNFVVPAAQLSPNGWRTVIDIVLNGTFYCTKAFGQRMMDTDKPGSIINLIATYAWTGGPGTVHSASAKAGVLAMTPTLAVEWAQAQIRVNAIAPGPIERTGGADKLFGIPAVAEAVRKDVPLGRLGTPEEIAWAASYLASDFSSYVNGACLTVDGGAWLNKGFIKYFDQL
jgi:NAD(P)-dependent dehydrogenase (short-subunit alcohol dehydrogenase family)